MIEEIKKRSANFKEEYLPFFNNNGEMREWNAMYEDNLYLLSIIEQAEKALQSIVDYPNTEMKSPEDLGYTYQTLAEEALQAIRGSE